MNTSHIDLEKLEKVRTQLREFLEQNQLGGLETAIASEQIASEIRQKLAAQWAGANQSLWQ